MNIGSIDQLNIGISCNLGESLVSWQQKLADGYEKDKWFAEPANTKDLVFQDGLWYKDNSVVVPDADDLRKQVMQELHDSPFSGHCGITKTTNLVKRTYWWPVVGEHVRQYVRTCHACQTINSRNKKLPGLLQAVELSLVPWDTVTMDFITQLPKTTSGHDAILVVVDKLSKMVHLAATTTTCSAAETARLFVDYVFKYHGLPRKKVTDRDARFTSAFNTAVCEMIGTRQAISTASHAHTDGQTERVNRVLEDMLRHYVAPSQDDWDDLLTAAEFAINNAYHESIATTPFMLKYGREPRLPVSLKTESRVPAANQFVQQMQRRITEARRAHQMATQRQKQHYDQRRDDVEYESGDWVLLNSKNLKFKSGAPKLLPRWVGPF